MISALTKSERLMQLEQLLLAHSEGLRLSFQKLLIVGAIVDIYDKNSFYGWHF